MTAHFGEYDLNKPTGHERTVIVERDFIHPSYDESNYDYDFALLRLSGIVTILSSFSFQLNFYLTS